MTTYVQFTPSTTSPFQFQATLDGNVYNIIVTWNVYAQGYYVNIYDISNNIVVSLPLIGSPSNYNISLTAGYFTSTLIYRTANQQFEISP